ncbi:KS-MAT linker domain-containing protein, partial [Burkholderia thailandensis]
ALDSVAGLARQLRREHARAVDAALAGATDLGAARNDGAAALSLRAIAHTLQVGRKALPERAAFVARDVAHLARLLDTFAATGDAPRPDGHRGRVRADEQPAEPLSPQHADPHRLAAAWVEGRAIDWAAAYSSGAPRRVSLPTYPFERRRYWVRAADAQSAVHATADGATAPDADADAKADVKVDVKADVKADARADAQAGAHVDAGAAAAAAAAVADILQSVTGLGPDEWRDDTTFDALGLDSLMIGEFTRRIEAMTGERDTTLLFRFRDLTALAAHLAHRHPAAWRADGAQRASSAASTPAPAQAGSPPAALASRAAR